jgi:formylglycine-generating enzyme required for sulfatase activity
MKTTTAVPFAVLVVAATLSPPAAIGTLVNFGSGANQFTMEFVTIGNPGNAADTTGSPNPAGSVPYAFDMGKYEVSEDMITKANAEGSLGITKDNRSANKPATSVSWNEAARFVNWLNTSSGFQPAYKFTTQPGDMGYSANENISLWTMGDAGFDAANPFRNSLAHYFLPSVNEWYKAAYHDAAAGTTGTYFNYPTGSDSGPDGIDFAGDTTFEAVFTDGGTNAQPNDITDVGVLSPYGTAGQGGNVFEWEETESDLVNNDGSANRGRRGGSWNFAASSLLSSNRQSNLPTAELNNFGFRVASIPEPSPILYGALITSCALLWKRLKS